MKADRLRIDQFAAVTAENFDAFEEAVIEYERRNRRERASWGILKPVSDLTFFFSMLSAACVFAELPVSPALLDIASMIWRSEGEDEISLAFVGSCILITALVSFVVHAVPAAVLKRVWPCEPSPPVRGGKLDKAEALEKRFEANCKSFSLCWTTLSIIAYPIIILVLDRAEVQAGVQGCIYAIILFVIFALIYAVPYVVYTIACLILYKTYNGTNGTGEPGRKLSVYVNSLRWEQEQQEEAKRRERDRLQGDALYRRATIGGAMDETLIAQAAELGSSPACLYMGRRLLEAWYEGQYTTSYTKTELEEMAELGWDYFLTAGTGEIPPESEGEAELGYLVFREAKERLNMSMYEWEEILKQLRRLKTSGKLPKRYEDIYDFAVEKAVDRIDMIAEHQRWSGIHTSDAGGPSSCGTMHDDLDAVERSLGGPGWSDGV